MVLLDTHTLLWLFGDSENLTARVVGAINTQERFISVVSLWEIAIKKGLADPKRKLNIKMSILEIAKECDRQGIGILPITPADCNRIEGLPHLHEDPFDRIIISQAMERGLVLLTKDERIWQYDNVETLW